MNFLTRLHFPTLVILLLSTQVLCMEESPEDQSDSPKRGTKRNFATYKETEGESRKKPQFKPFRSKERDSQLRITTQQSPFVEGEESARLLWAKSLEMFSGGKKPSKLIAIPDTLHKELAYVGNHLRAFAHQNAYDMKSFKRNILIPHVSFVVKRDLESSEKIFVKGSYINFDPEHYSECATAFISGGDSMPWMALREYNHYRKTHDRETDRAFDLPFIRVFSGNEVEKILGKTLPSAEQHSLTGQSDCLYHTEEMFYEMLLANPAAIVSIAQEVLWPVDEIVHVVFDFYSWWDVCRPCQKRFRTEYFHGEVHKKLEQAFDTADFSFPKASGILPLFRVTSHKQHHPDSLRDMNLAASGLPERCGFEAKTLSQSHLVLSTRKTTGSFDYPAILQKIQA